MRSLHDKDVPVEHASVASHRLPSPVLRAVLVQTDCPLVQPGLLAAASRRRVRHRRRAGRTRSAESHVALCTVGGAASLEERKEKAVKDKSVPIFSCPASILGVDLVLEPGESKSC